MKQYKLPLIVNEGRRKRAAPNTINLKVSFKNGIIIFEKEFSIIKSAISQDRALVMDIIIPAPLPTFQVTKAIGNR
jgi:hypothetical protein